MGSEGQRPPGGDDTAGSPASQPATGADEPVPSPATPAAENGSMTIIGSAPFTEAETPPIGGEPIVGLPPLTPDQPPAAETAAPADLADPRLTAEEPEWAKATPGDVPMQDIEAAAGEYIDDDGLPAPGATAEEISAEAARRAEARRRRTRTIVRELVETGLLALIVFLSVRASFQNFKVDGNSMFPTLHNGQFLIVNKLVYSQVDVDTLGKVLPFVDTGNSTKRNVFHGPERGDIVVLVDPHKTDTDLIKRVIGLPGETVEIVDGKVYINDQLLIEPYIQSPWHDSKPKVTVPAGEYFVMGDNRDNSLDSRSPSVGMIPADYIVGKAMLSYWPFDEFGLAPNRSPRVSPTDVRPKVSR